MEKQVRLRQHTVHVQFLGSIPSPTTPVLIFLHEALGSLPQWKTFPASLHAATSLPCLIPERQGHGKSDPLSHERTPSYLHDYMYELQELIGELLPPKQPVILVGHSDGGTIALLYARHFPDFVKGIVTMAAHTFVEEITLNGIEPAVMAYNNGKLNGLHKIHEKKTDALFYAWANTWRSDAFRSWDIRSEIKGISCPTLIIQGAGDQYGSLLQVSSIEEAIANHHTIIIPDCGHHPHLEKPEIVLSHCTDFLSHILV